MRHGNKNSVRSIKDLFLLKPKFQFFIVLLFTTISRRILVGEIQSPEDIVVTFRQLIFNKLLTFPPDIIFAVFSGDLEIQKSFWVGKNIWGKSFGRVLKKSRKKKFFW